ncbi:cytochrome P450 [Citricoccus sp. NPDC055426]|uniref:cytochrome P450 n=1 Tax=Citricoccus sp. NPDC055426 TaxID=3155536 RepID=UPI003431DD45
MTITQPAVDVSALPVVDLDTSALADDPYSTYRHLRETAPVVWAPAINKILFTTFEACAYVENHPEIFSSHVEGAAMVKALGGRPLIRKDDPDHATERQSMNRPLRPRNIQGAWNALFEQNAETYLDRLVEAGPGADLNTEFAMPLAGKNLIDMLGLHGVDPLDIARWSLDFIAGSGNVTDDPDIWLRCETSRAECDAALDEAIPRLRAHPDASITSAMLAGGLPEDAVRNNVKLTISGGINEPQHMITNIVYELSRHPETLEAARQDPTTWDSIFNEAVRKYTPIGMITRETVAKGEFEGFHIPAGAQVGALLASANRDEGRFPDPDGFSLHRSETTSLAFGRGVHQCAGKWAAQSSIGRIAIPRLYERLPDLHQDRPETWNGWVFRGMTSLPVTW